jgi:hypothetical protein
MVIHSRQQPESLPADQLIGHEVHAPAVIGTLSDRTSFVNLNALSPTWLLPPDSLSFFAVQPVHELPVHEPPFPTQEHPEPRISELYPTGRQVSKSYAKLGPRITPAPVTVGRSGKPEHSTGSTFGSPVATCTSRTRTRCTAGLKVFLRARPAASSCRGSGPPPVA